MSSRQLLRNLSLIDIGANMTDSVYGADVADVLGRAARAGVGKVFITGGSLKESKAAIELCNKKDLHNVELFSTVGCHPTRCEEFDSAAGAEAYLNGLDDCITRNHVRNGGCVVAVGEIGLDYDRLMFCGKETQKKYFEKQLALAEKHQLPVFFHCRNTEGDFFSIVSAYANRLVGGVVHSFTGTKEEALQYLELNLFIGINGCSLKSNENLEVVKLIPLNRLLIETDAPWCEIKNTHASKALLATAGQRRESGKSISEEILSEFGTCTRKKVVPGRFIKSRNEPAHLIQVLEVLYELRRDEVESIEHLARIIQENTVLAFSLP